VDGEPLADGDGAVVGEAEAEGKCAGEGEPEGEGAVPGEGDETGEAEGVAGDPEGLADGGFRDAVGVAAEHATAATASVARAIVRAVVDTRSDS
jgi:hypothetical protein